MIQCLLASIEDRSLDKFSSLLSLADEVADRNLVSPCTLWPKVFSALLAKVVELDCPDLLARILVLARDPQEGRLSPDPPDNDPTLLKACEGGRYEVVRVLVAKGYRLRSTHFPSSGGGRGERRAGSFR